jgi:hypothetical protein
MGSEFWILSMYSDSLQEWDLEGIILDKMEQRQKSDSVLRLINRFTSDLVGMCKTDSINFIYDATLCDVSINMSVFNEEQLKFNIYLNPTIDNVTIDFVSNYSNFDGCKLKFLIHWV